MAKTKKQKQEVLSSTPVEVSLESVVENAPVESLVEEKITAVAAEIEDKTEENKEELPPVKPHIGDPEWHDYVMSFFEEDELIEGSPNNNGLKRVFARIFGIIYTSNVSVVNFPTIADPYRATVIVTMNLGEPTIRSFQDAVDISEFNTTAPYVNFPINTAVTMAENRIIRKALFLKVLSSEELNKSATAPSASVPVDLMATGNNLATDIQQKVITSLATTLGISLEKMFNTMTIANKKLETLLYTEAQEVINLLTQYNRGPDNGGLATPDSIF